MINESVYKTIVNIRRDLHQHPETGFDVQRTAGIVAATLTSLGLTVRQNVGKTGVVADLVIPQAANTIAFRADMDALPMDELSDLPYRSQVPGKAHMCGHDGHTAILLGAAMVLSKERARLKNSVRFIFQPSEEQKPGGAPGMIDEGCLDGVSSIYGLHVWPWLETGKVGICPGPSFAQSDVFDITVTGRGGHAAAPHGCIDPIVAGSQLVIALQNIVSRMLNPLDPAVVSVTHFEAGTAYNVIPETATLAGTVRTYSKENLKNIKQAINMITLQIAKAYGAHAQLEYIDGYPPLINDLVSSDHAARVASKFLQGDQIIFPGERVMFGEDFAYYLQKVPGCFIQLGCRNEQKNCIYPLHHPKFSLDEECFKTGVRLFVELAL